MIAYHFGKKISQLSLSKMIESSKQGISLDDLKELLSKLNIDSTALILPISDVKELPCPAILHWDQSHFVVLYDIDIDDRLFYNADPDEGLIKLTEKDLIEHWCTINSKGVVLLVSPAENFCHTEGSETLGKFNFFKYILSLITNNEHSFIFITICSLLCMLADLCLPLLTQATVDDGIQNKNIELIIIIALFQFFVVLGNVISSKYIQFLSSKLGLYLNKNLTTKYLSLLMALPLIFFDKKSSSDLIQKFEDQLRIKNYVVQLPSSLFLLSINAIIFSGLLIYYNILLFVIFLLFITLQIIWNLIFLNKRKDLDYSYFRSSAKIQNFTYESINGIQDIKMSNSFHSVVNTWEAFQDKFINLGIKSSLMDIKISSGSSVIEGIRSLVLTAMCAILVIKSQISIGEMLAVGYIIGRLSNPWASALSLINQTQDANTSFERLDEVLNSPISDVRKVQSKDNSIIFNNVSFRYVGKSSPFVIQNLSLEIKNRGRVIAIVGESGCGKSTLLKLMMGLYEPQYGQISLGQVNVTHLDQNEWISKCGIVMQNGYIFSNSLLYNITFSNKVDDSAKLHKILEIVGLWNFVEAMPSKYETIIGATGIELSGGQKQRLLIARALYRTPEILIMDEPTSSLDASTEAKITKQIFEFQKGKTTIIAAHRLSTIRHADTIMFMTNGNIVEVGTHNQLLEKQGHYYELVKSQL